jgi:POT family proton-dependent oligopeptide transporter
MLIIFTFNVLFWCFFEQAGSSFNFLAENIVNRDVGGWDLPDRLVPVGQLDRDHRPGAGAGLAVGEDGRANPSIPRKFGLGLIFNGAGLPAADVRAVAAWSTETGKIPFWTLFMVYVIQSVGELCLSPIGLSMVTKLAPRKPGWTGMGGWFLSTGIGNNLSGMFRKPCQRDRKACPWPRRTPATRSASTRWSVRACCCS